MAPVLSKMLKVDSVPYKLWTNEERMFCEKVFTLNKSTTKHIIAGYEAQNFTPIVKICDRVSGVYITIKKENFQAFVCVIESILSGTYTLERGVVVKTGDSSGIKVNMVRAKVWKLSQIDLPHACVLIHENSLKTLLRIDRIILSHLNRYASTSFENFFNELARDTVDMILDEIVEYLYTKTTVFPRDSVETQIITDLICNIDSYSKLSKFADGFYYRTTLK